MELSDHEEQMDSFEVKFTPRRNVLLLVLCILTWVFCTYLLVFFFGSLIYQSKNTVWTMAMGRGNNLRFYLEYLVVPILCSAGALFMLLGKKIGFWIYTIGQLITIGFSVYSIIGVMDRLGPTLFWVVLANLVPIAFIVVYATQVFKRKTKQIDVNF